MKTGYRILKGNNYAGCTHSRIYCEVCGSYFFVHHKMTKKDIKDMVKLLEKVEAAEKKAAGL